MLFEQIAANKRRTVLLVLVFFGVLTALGAALGHLMAQSVLFGVFLAMIFGGIYAGTMLAQSTQVVMSLNRARLVTAEEYPDLYQVVEDMALVAQIPMPQVYVIEDAALNAFATGPSPQKAAVAATTGLLGVMNREELEAVMAHEVSHIRNYDIRLATIAVALVSVISLLSSMGTRLLWYGGGRQAHRTSDDGGQSGLKDILILVGALLAVLLAPLAATVVQLAISRQREFLADASAVALTRNPYGLIRALKKLDQSPEFDGAVDSASRALYIHWPQLGQGGLFRTHPPIADRIARLEQM